MTPERRKVFIIGFNKCGTRSINAFFHRHGFATIHWRRGDLARAMARNVEDRQDPLKGFEKYDVFSDMIAVSDDKIIDMSMKFKYIYKYHPEAFYILNTRNCEDWLESRARHGRFLEITRRVQGLARPEDVIAAWRRDWYRHHLHVTDFFRGPEREKQFFIWNIDNPQFDRLQTLTGLEIDRSAYPQLGVTQAGP